VCQNLQQIIKEIIFETAIWLEPRWKWNWC